MKRNISMIEYADRNGMSPEEFTDDIVKSLVAICSITLDENMADCVQFTVDDPEYAYKVVLSREIK